MSKTVKFTKEELDDITKIRDGYKSKINENLMKESSNGK